MIFNTICFGQYRSSAALLCNIMRLCNRINLKKICMGQNMLYWTSSVCITNIFTYNNNILFCRYRTLYFIYVPNIAQLDLNNKDTAKWQVKKPSSLMKYFNFWFFHIHGAGKNKLLPIFTLMENIHILFNFWWLVHMNLSWCK